MSPARVCVIGIDGATLDLIEPFVQQGKLPSIARLMSEGSYGTLRSVIPPITAPAWTSFMTGKNPGKHGLYDFTGRRPGTYQTRPYNASHRAAESLWNILSRAGKRVCVINVPMTYPPESVNGVLVSGMGAPATAEDYCFPADVLSELRAAVPTYEVQREGIFDPHGREQEMYQALAEMTELRRKAALHFLQDSRWDFFMVVFMATDYAQHYFWQFMDPEHSEFKAGAAENLQNAILRTYQQIDSSIADILEHIDDDMQVILMSDHGFGRQEKYFHFNTWLWQQGYLRFKRNPLSLAKEALFRSGVTPSNIYAILHALRQGRNVRRAIRKNKSFVSEAINRTFLSFRDVDWKRTRAYSVGNIGPVYINLKGREPQGTVVPGTEYEALLAELTDKMTGLRMPDTGEQIAATVVRGNEIFVGERASEGPDLVFLPDDMRNIGYGELEFSTNRWVTDSDRAGGHRMEGFLTMHGPGVRSEHKLSTANLVDLAPTILAAMNVPVPEDMDGKILLDAFAGDFQNDLQISYQVPQAVLQAAPVDLSPEQEAEILERLKGLGYVE